MALALMGSVLWLSIGRELVGVALFGRVLWLNGSGVVDRFTCPNVRGCMALNSGFE